MTTFAHIASIETLNLTDTNLSFDNLKTFETNIGEPLVTKNMIISYNNLENTDFKTESTALKNLEGLFISHCNVTSIADVFKQLGPNLKLLDISGNNLTGLSADNFKNLPNLIGLKLDHGNLLHIDFSIFDQSKELFGINMSYNALKTIDLSSAAFAQMKIIKLEGNELTEIVGLTKTNFPALKELQISMNQFSCEYLTKFIPQIRSEFPNLKLLGEPFKQKHGEICHINWENSSTQNNKFCKYIFLN